MLTNSEHFVRSLTSHSLRCSHIPLAIGRDWNAYVLMDVRFPSNLLYCATPPTFSSAVIITGTFPKDKRVRVRRRGGGESSPTRLPLGNMRMMTVAEGSKRPIRPYLRVILSKRTNDPRIDHPHFLRYGTTSSNLQGHSWYQNEKHETD